MNPKTPIWFGALLVGLGLGGYFGTGTSSITALIPSFFGAALLLLGSAISRERLRVPALYGVALVAGLGWAGTLGGVADFVRLLFGVAVDRPLAVTLQAAMALLCAILIVLSIRDVLDERRRQRRRAQGTGYGGSMRPQE